MDRVRRVRPLRRRGTAGRIHAHQPPRRLKQGAAAMPVSQARVPTGRAGRYLSQLRKHTGHPGFPVLRHGPGDGGAAPVPRHTEWSDTDGVVDFGWGRCTLHAIGDALILHAEADDQQNLRRIQDALAARLDQIGRRDHLTVTWRPRSDESAAAIIDALLTPAGRADPFPLYA